MSMNKQSVVCYMRVATCEQLNDKEHELKQFAKKYDNEFTDFITGQQSDLAAYSETLNELLHNQSARNISVVPVIWATKNRVPYKTFQVL